MRIKCINNEFGKRCITVGRIYDVVAITERLYYIRNDNGSIDGFFNYRFINYDKEIRTKRLKEILDEL